MRRKTCPTCGRGMTKKMAKALGLPPHTASGPRGLSEPAPKRDPKEQDAIRKTLRDREFQREAVDVHRRRVMSEE